MTIHPGMGRSFWESIGFCTRNYPFSLMVPDSTTCYAWQVIDGGWVVDLGNHHITAKSPLVAAASVLAALVVHGPQIEGITQPAARVSEPPKEHPWHVWDDGLRKAYADMLVENRRKNHPEYDFKVVLSEFYTADLYQIEGRKKS